MKDEKISHRCSYTNRHTGNESCKCHKRNDIQPTPLLRDSHKIPTARTVERMVSLMGSALYYTNLGMGYTHKRGDFVDFIERFAKYN